MEKKKEMSNSSTLSKDLSINRDGSAVNPRAFQKHFRRDSMLMAQLIEIDPEMAGVIRRNNVDRLQYVLRQRQRHRCNCRSIAWPHLFGEPTCKRSLSRLKQLLQVKILRHPISVVVTAQDKIEALIRQKRIADVSTAALEGNPVTLGAVEMLYVNIEVNNVPLKAFVHSGVQSTVISKGCVEQCGLQEHIDESCGGISPIPNGAAGQANVLGLINDFLIKIGDIFYPCSFVVWDSPDIEVLFGFDMLRKLKCAIDLKEKLLRIGAAEILLLRGKYIPSHSVMDPLVPSSIGTSGTQSAADKSTNVPCTAGIGSSGLSDALSK